MPELLDHPDIDNTPVPLDPMPPMEPLNPYRGKVVDLVNPYMTRETNRRRLSSAYDDMEYAVWWLQRHPGRWALVGDGGMGASKDMAVNMGLHVLVRGERTYAQVPHPEAEALNEALHRSARLIDVLPRVTRDPFNWTKAELAEAVEIARANLFPVADRKAS